MNDEKSREGLRTISNIFVGAASGLLADMLVLFLLSFWSFHLGIKTVLIGLIFAVFLPCCLDVFGQRGLNLYIVELVMILVSVLVCLLYAHQVSGNTETRNLLFALFSIFHGLSAVVTVLRLKYMESRGGRDGTA